MNVLPQSDAPVMRAMATLNKTDRELLLADREDLAPSRSPRRPSAR
jgi:hypothetical protein